MATVKRNSPAVVLKAQEIPFAHPHSRFFFKKPLVATPAALRAFGPELISELYGSLQEKAREHAGLDYLQVFEDTANPGGPKLWFIEDAQVVTGLLPEDY